MIPVVLDILIPVFMISFCGYQIVKTRKEKKLSFSTIPTTVTVIERTWICTAPRIYIIKYVDEVGQEGRLYALRGEGKKLKQGEVISIKMINNKAHLAEEKYNRKIVLSFLCGLYFVLFLGLWAYGFWSYKVLAFIVATFALFVLIFAFLYRRQMSKGLD